MRVLGIDLGSREVKIVVMDKKQLVFKEKVSTMSFYRDYCIFDKKLAVDLKKLDIGQIDAFISTCYGRNNTDLNRFKAMNEIKAHVYGGLYQTGLKNFKCRLFPQFWEPYWLRGLKTCYIKLIYKIKKPKGSS